MNDLNSYDIDFISPLLDEFICGHCDKVLKIPMLVGCCSNHFCEQCLQTEDKSSYVCPDSKCESKGREITAVLDSKKWKKILDLEVVCPFSRHGCLWTGKLQEQVEHTNHYCKYTTCTSGCGVTLDKSEMAEHLKNYCLKRLVSCIHCNIQGEYQLINGEHINYCMTDCPNDCGISKFKKVLLNEHLQMCPHEVVKCNYSYAGCTRQEKRAEMAAHLEKDVHVHFSLVTKYLLAEIDTKDQLLIDQNKILSSELENLSEIYCKELDEKNRRIVELENKVKDMIQLNQKQRKATLSEELKTITKDFELRYTEIEMNLRRMNPILHNPAERKNEDVETQILLHVGNNKTEIWKGVHKDNGMAVVIKKDTPGNVRSEAEILSKLSHTNVINLYSVVTDIEYPSMILEYMPCGNLHEYLKKNTLLLHQQISVCREAANGLEYLHMMHCMHRQIRVDNVLITGELHCKINDFSLATIVSQYNDYAVNKYSRARIKWSAPEVLKNNRYYLKTDVWALGILMWQVVMGGEEPYTGLTTAQARAQIVAGIVPSQPKDSSRIFYAAMKNCWKVDPAVRPTFKALYDLLDHVKDSHKYTDMTDFTYSI